MSDIRFNQWLHQSGTGGVSQDHIGNIGIGTTNPSIVVSAANTAVLNVGVITANNLFVNNAFNGDITGNVTGNISGATGTFSGNVDIADKIIHTGDTDTAMRFPADNTFAVDTAGSERLRITSTGAVQITGVDDQDNLLVKASNTHFAIHQDDSDGEVSLRAQDGSGSNNTKYMTFFTEGGSGTTERLRITSGGDMGLGTATPTARLDVRRDDADGKIAEFHQSSGYGIQIRSSQTVATIRAEYNQALIFETGTTATERVRILSDGKVAIGGVTANSLLDVHGGDGISITHSGDTFLQSRTTGTTGTNYLEFKDSGGAAGAISYHHNGDSMRFKINGAERARIDSDGHLQIRHEGVASVSGTDSRHTRYIVKESGGQEAILGSVFAQGQSGWGGDLVFASKAANGNPSSGLTERMRIGNDGKFYYATTSQGPHGGFFNIDASSSGRNGMNVKGTTANYAYISSAGGSSGDHIHFSNYSNSNQETGRIKDNQSNVTYYTSSDYRLKDNIVPITDGITRVKQLNPVRHTWINNPALGTVDGWIAHELDEVCPDAVDGEKDAVREDGSIKAQAADYGRITPLLAAALKEAITKIEALETRVTALEG